MSEEQTQAWLDAAIEQAQISWDSGGIPIGSVLVDAAGTIVSRGHNKRVHVGDPTAHGEVVCIREAGRRRDWDSLTIVTTLWPCTMCAGLAIFLQIPRIIVGEEKTFSHNPSWAAMLSQSKAWLKESNVETTVLNDSRCIALMERMMREKPDLWNEDLAH